MANGATGSTPCREPVLARNLLSCVQEGLRMPKFDEMYTVLPFGGSDVRPHYKRYGEWLARQSDAR